MKARTGGEKARHLWQRFVQKIAEGKTYALSWKVKVIILIKKWETSAVSTTDGRLKRSDALKKIKNKNAVGAHLRKFAYDGKYTRDRVWVG